MTGSIRNLTYALNKLLRDNVSLVANRVYPVGVREENRTPRISVSELTPRETFAGIGANVPVWKNVAFKIDVWDKDPIMVEKVAEQVEDAVAKNRSYRPASFPVRDEKTGATSTVTNSEYFMNLRVTGGSATDLNASKQLYQRTINVGGLWLQLA